MNLVEQNQMRKLESENLQLKLKVKALKYEQDRRQKQLMKFIGNTIELLEGLGEDTTSIIDYVIPFYRGRR